MLKALELFGFKSFADKTRFEFPPGITVVVGPNGSGKSNIVDAIKWVLGEQSAKSLRGKDMADVIFKGSGTSGRKMMNTAEATIVFENSDRRLPVDAQEVHVTRRVYRSGEGEYLINGQACRLKDIRDMFRGTGVGTDAYSLIEQGKVDQLLQASPKDRRAIFEEAAGISRFKAKKIEAERRLERVDQNLLRLSDIVEEVENRLKNVRAQATKARRYREYTERLQQLRTHVALTDWRRLTQQLDDLDGQCRQQRQALEELAAHGEALEAQSLQIDVDLVQIDEQSHRLEAGQVRNREFLAARVSLCELEHTRCRELADESLLHRAQIAAAQGRAGDLQQRIRDLTQQLRQAAQDFQQVSGRHEALEAALAELTAAWEQQRSETESLRARHVERMRAAAQSSNEASRLATQIAAIEATLHRAEQRSEQVQRQHEQAQQNLLVATEQEQALLAQLQLKSDACQQAQRDLEHSRRLRARRQEDAAHLIGRRRGAAERATLLEELEDRREGILPGVRQLLDLQPADAAADPTHAGDVSQEICGIVADLLRADVQIAPLVDAALGENAQLVVIRGTDLLDQMAGGRLPLQGRAGLLSLARIPRRFELRRVQWDGRQGVIGRADRLVQFDPPYAALVEFLLGRTYFVETLADALRYYAQAPGRARFVTLEGEVVERDGTVFVGPPHTASALVSRRSELEALHREIATLAGQIEAAQREIQGLTENIQHQESAVRRLMEEQNSLQDRHAHQRALRNSSQERVQSLQAEHAGYASEAVAARTQRTQALEDLHRTQKRLTELEQDVREMESRLTELARDSQHVDRRRQERLQEVTRTRVERATSQQRLLSLRTQHQQMEEARHERTHALEEARANWTRCRQRLAAAERAILDATSELATLYLEKEAFEQQIAALRLGRESRQNDRGQLAGQLQHLRKQAHRHEAQLHEHELEAGQVRHQRETLAERIREDYGVEIAELQGQAAQQLSEQQRGEIEEEIAALRRRISNIGAVNMEALEELDDLESRFASLSGQSQDLTHAKDALERIIHKINADSRRLFVETLEAIRGNFQIIYRKAFGGGKADIVLEEGGDVLECGVDILATPPGKPTFNNSLLSGGEKALTAVSLLLAIFQFRPSPFCVLDEVDAPFDEANIGRFIDVLRDFLGWTKFVIVTHSKKTMTAATTLYGVTMQESGVSKRVSVRFEDVREDGEIDDDALQRDERGVA
jgi:chromosome segregation protein